MPGCGWLRLMLPPGWEGFWRLCVRTLLPPRVGCVLLRERVCGATLSCRRALEFALDWRLTLDWRLSLRLTLELDCERVLLLLLRTLLPPRVAALLPERDWLEAAGCELRCEDWLRLTELSPLVLPDWLALRFCEEGAETEEAGRLPPLLRELPLPDPLRELLPPLV
jgi:hypothetical protein